MLVALLALAAAAPGIGRDISVFFWKAGELRSARSDRRFEGLTLPPAQRFGFVTDVSGLAAVRRYYEALHAFAPAILVQGASERLVLADVADPASVERLSAELKARVVGRGSPGVALLERE